MACCATCSSDALDCHEDAALVACYDALQHSLDAYMCDKDRERTSAQVHDARSSCDAAVTARAAYEHLCVQQQQPLQRRVRPSPLFCAFLDAQVAAAKRDGNVDDNDDEAVVTPSASSQAAVLCFDRTHVGCMALLPVFVTLSVYCSDTLRVLSLCAQQMTSAHVQLLCTALAPMTRLRSLDVSHNPCGSGGVRALLWLVQRTPTLVCCEARGVHAIASLTRRLRDAVERNASSSPSSSSLRQQRCGDDDGDADDDRSAA